MVRCNPFPLLGVDIDKGTCIDNLYFLPDQPVRYRVIVLGASHIDEAVRVYQQLTAVLDFKAFSPKLLQSWFINGYEALLTGERQALHPPLIMEHHLLRNSRIKFLDGEELTVTEWGVYVMIGKLDVVFNQVKPLPQ